MADRARPGDVDRLRPSAPPPLGGRLLRARRDRARAARLARRGAAGERGLRWGITWQAGVRSGSSPPPPTPPKRARGPALPGGPPGPAAPFSGGAVL